MSFLWSIRFSKWPENLSSWSSLIELRRSLLIIVFHKFDSGQPILLKTLSGSRALLTDFTIKFKKYHFGSELQTESKYVADQEDSPCCLRKSARLRKELRQKWQLSLRKMSGEDLLCKHIGLKDETLCYKQSDWHNTHPLSTKWWHHG